MAYSTFGRTAKHILPCQTKPPSNGLTPPTAHEEAEFKRLDEIVQMGAKGFVEVGAALMQIRDQKLWRAGNFKNWSEYCQSVQEFSRIQAYRLIEASQCVLEMQNLSNFSIRPKSESQ